MRAATGTYWPTFHSVKRRPCLQLAIKLLAKAAHPRILKVQQAVDDLEVPPQGSAVLLLSILQVTI